MTNEKAIEDVKTIARYAFLAGAIYGMNPIGHPSFEEWWEKGINYDS